MRRYIYILLASITLWGCFKSDINSLDPNNEDGTVTLALNLKLASSEVTSVPTRSSSGWEAKENITKITGYAFVFEALSNEDGSISDASKLMQKVAFKTTGDDANNQTVYVTLDEQSDACFVRLMTDMTQHTSDQIDRFVSQKMSSDDPATYPSSNITTFADYKDIDITLLGYYQSADAPDPNNLTKNQSFPLASPGISMPNGISEASVADANLLLYMVPVASKIDVNVGSTCEFKLKEVTLLNGAKKALMRSTVLENDGVTLIDSYPLPTNLGGVTKFAAVSADEYGKTTENTPIYFYPNEGDKPAQSDDVINYADEDLTLSDELNGENPTYLIIKGRAEGYDVDGYYKIAVRYIPTTVTAHDKSTIDPDSEDTYDILRNNHYKVYLNKVDNPGYATQAEAIAGVANNISFDINVDTNDDSRNETIVSDSGLYSMEFNTSSVYVRTYIYENETLDLNMSFWLGGNDTANVDDEYYDNQKAYITCSEGITINSLNLGSNVTPIDEDGSFAIDWEQGYLVNFSVLAAASDEETITIRYGNIAKEIPVYFDNSRISMFDSSAITVNDKAVFSDGVAEVVGRVYDYVTGVTTTDNFDTFFGNSNGNIQQYPEIEETLVNMSNFNGRYFDGYVYSTDNAEGVIRLYCHQGSLPFHIAYELDSTPNTDLDPYYMINYEDFEHLSTSVNGTNCLETRFTSCNFKMLKDIDLQEGDTNRQHTAVGCDTQPFSGHFDGDNHEVTNLYINKSDQSHQGLFGDVYLGSIKNITVRGDITSYNVTGGLIALATDYTLENCNTYVSITVSQYCVGGLIGLCSHASDSVTIKNCNNYGDITGNYNLGGLVGYSTTDLTIDNSINYGGINGKGNMAGVVGCGRKTLNISKCVNNGDINSIEIIDDISDGGAFGGIIGQSYEKTIITECTNNGEINCNDSNAGGLIGYAKSNNAINLCNNTSDITGYSSVGGIVGYSEGYTSDHNTITECSNIGKIASTENSITNCKVNIGGLVGYASYTNILNCSNGSENNSDEGSVTGEGLNIGGIAGCAENDPTIQGCTNYAAVTGERQIGGLVGEGSSLTVAECNNKGDIISDSDALYSAAGGLIGSISRSSVIETSHNYGEVTAVNYSGGLVGSNSILSVIMLTNCTNYGNVTSTVSNDYAHSGGVVGYSSNATITNCENRGTVTGSSQLLGGIIGSSASGLNKVINCDNYGYINGTSNTAGIVGYTAYYANSSTEIEGCTNYGNVNGSSKIGGIAGCSTNTASESTIIKNSINKGNISGHSFVGGVLGYANRNSNTVVDCSNTGEINGHSYIGGILGDTGNNLDIELHGCINEGAVTATNNHAAGIVASCDKEGFEIYNCYNTAAITSNEYVGGIVAEGNEVIYIKNCYNTAPLSKTNNTFYPDHYIGGILAYASSGGEMDYCYNSGTITTTSSDKTMAGYILGFNNDESEDIFDVLGNCYYPTSLLTICNVSDTFGTPIDDEYIKSQDFVNDMNKCNESDDKYFRWTQDTEGINNGYPIFDRQLTTD